MCVLLLYTECLSLVRNQKLSSAYFLSFGKVCSIITSMRKGYSHTAAKSSPAVGQVSVFSTISSCRSTDMREFMAQMFILTVYMAIYL